MFKIIILAAIGFGIYYAYSHFSVKTVLNQLPQKNPMTMTTEEMKEATGLSDPNAAAASVYYNFFKQ